MRWTRGQLAEIGILARVDEVLDLPKSTRIIEFACRWDGTPVGLGREVVEAFEAYRKRHAWNIDFGLFILRSL